jgi:hypothetical protein
LAAYQLSSLRDVVIVLLGVQDLSWTSKLKFGLLKKFNQLLICYF